MAIDVEDAYRRFGPMVVRRCRALLTDEEQAVDAMHDVFVRLMRERERLDDRALSSLLYRIATNVSLNRLRTKKRRPETPDDDLLAALAHATDFEEAMQGRTLVQRLFGGVAESTTTMAVMHWVDGMSLEEVSAETGMSVSGVRKRLRVLRDDLNRRQR
jgi:RNA polymerase sigma-70 factor (ECF subfamily)